MDVLDHPDLRSCQRGGFRGRDVCQQLPAEAAAWKMRGQVSGQVLVSAPSRESPPRPFFVYVSPHSIYGRSGFNFYGFIRFWTRKGRFAGSLSVFFFFWVVVSVTLLEDGKFGNFLGFFFFF